MNIYHIYREFHQENIDIAGWDEYLGHVIVAHDDASARRMAQTQSAYEGKAIWLTCSCDCIGTTSGHLIEEGEAIVLSSYNAG